MDKIGRLMLIDDSKIDVMVYGRIIARSGLVEAMETFYFADDALASLCAPGRPWPDAILLDINMPRMTGFEFLEAASARFGPDFGAVVVMLTTSLDPADRTRAESYAAVREFINKPLTEANLRQIRALLGAAR